MKIPCKLICLTPVKNEAWCLDLFLKVTSLWADYIIIADQNSTDESKKIAKRYTKVILIENQSKEYNEGERQKLLINESRKIPGDKILFTLDADEIFSANFDKTEDWQKILHSKPGEVFGFQWANITPDQKHYSLSSFFYPWAIHDDGTEHQNYVRDIHSMRIPYPIKADLGYWHVTQFKVFHFSSMYESRAKSKNRYYQFLEKIKGNYSNPITFFRTYTLKKSNTYTLPKEWLYDFYLENECFIELTINESFWFDSEIINFIECFGIGYFRSLPIWDEAWLKKINRSDPRHVTDKVIFYYLNSTQKYYPSIIIRSFDKLLKIIFYNANQAKIY